MWIGVPVTGSIALDTQAHSRQLNLSSSPPLSKSGTREVELAEKDIQRKKSEFWRHHS